MAPRRETALLPEERVTALGVVSPPPIHVDAPAFNGSLAMLFQCVKNRKVDLLDVPLAPICEAYFAYLMQAAVRDLDEAAAALLALAYLLERKAWMLLPVENPEPEADEAMELPEPTTYEYAAAIEALRVWEEERSRRFFRPAEAGPDPYELPFVLGNVSVTDLAIAFEKLLRKANPEPMAPLSKPRKSLADQMSLVLKAVGAAWQSLEGLIEEPFTRNDAVYWFLALLELIRLGQVAVRLHGDEVQFARPHRKAVVVQETLEESLEVTTP
jgi:segregation and condensation protein A